MGFFEVLGHLLDPKWIIEHGGLYLLLAIIFAETGLFVGFFLPGDTLLFVAGVCGDILSENFFGAPVPVIILLVSAAGVLGNYFGYAFGALFGPYLYKRKESWLFKRERLDKAQEFYKRFGGMTIIIGRFVPIVRTFAPIVAGIIRMNFPKFSLFNALGSIAWVGSIMLTGYYIGKAFPQIEHYLHWFIPIIIIIILFPVLKSLIFRKKKTDATTATEANTPTDINKDPMV